MDSKMLEVLTSTILKLWENTNKRKRIWLSLSVSLLGLIWIYQTFFLSSQNSLLSQESLILLTVATTMLVLLGLGLSCFSYQRELNSKPKIKFFISDEIYWKIFVNNDNTFSIQEEPYCPIHKTKYYKIDNRYLCNSDTIYCKYPGGEKYSFDIMKSRAVSNAEYIIYNDISKLLDKIN